ncbi:leucine-rich repeat protein [Rubneribacter sp.]
MADVPGSTFNGCSSLSEISLPKLSSLGASAFAGTGLTEYTVPASVDATSATGLFSGCSKLKKVDLSAASLGAIPDRFFKDCTALAEVVWPQGGVKSIGELAFQNTGLASVDLSGMAGVTLGGGAFRDCASLASVVLPSGVSLVDAGSNGGQFQGCTKLASIDLSNTKLTSLRSNLFDGCTALSSVKLPSTLEAIGNYAFRNCTSLAALTLPDGLKTIGRESFGGCSSLANVALPSSVTDIESGAFNNTPALIKFTLGPNLWLGVPEESWSKDSDDTWSTGAIFTTTPATTIGRPEADFVAKTSWSSVAEVDLSLYGNHYIPPYTFMGLNKLEEVVIPKQVRTVMEGAFMGCTSLRDVYCFSPDISFVISEGQTGDSSLGWTSKTYPSFCAWGMGIAGQPEVKSLSGINFYGLAYSNNKLLEWCEVSDNTFVPFVVLEDFAADEALALFGYEVTGYNNVAVADLVYTGQALEPQIKVTFTDRDGVAPRMLDASDCQSIVYRDAAGNVVDSIVEPGAYTVTVTGDGKSVFGTQTISFKVVDPGASGGQQGDDQQQNQYQQNQQNQQNQQQYGPYQQGAYQQGATAQQAGYATTQAAQQGAALSQTGDGSPTGPLATVAALALGAATAAATAVRRRTRR